VQTRFLRSQQDLKAKILEQHVLADDQSSNPIGKNVLYVLNVLNHNAVVL